MIVVSLLTLVACVVTGILIIRYGNLTLRRQRNENRKRTARRLWEEREREIYTSLDILGSLADKRDKGLLEISDKSWLWLVSVQKSHPEYLEELLLYLDVHAYHTRELEHVPPIRIISPEEVVAAKREKKHRPNREHTPKDGLMIQPSIV